MQAVIFAPVSVLALNPRAQPAMDGLGGLPIMLLSQTRRQKGASNKQQNESSELHHGY